MLSSVGQCEDSAAWRWRSWHFELHVFASPSQLGVRRMTQTPSPAHRHTPDPQQSCSLRLSKAAHDDRHKPYTSRKHEDETDKDRGRGGGGGASGAARSERLRRRGGFNGGCGSCTEKEEETVDARGQPA
eukprot:650148-Rhodomonas_salina.3